MSTGTARRRGKGRCGTPRNAAAPLAPPAVHGHGVRVHGVGAMVKVVRVQGSAAEPLHPEGLSVGSRRGAMRRVVAVHRVIHATGYEPPSSIYIYIYIYKYIYIYIYLYTYIYI